MPEDKPKRPARPRAETMQRFELRSRYYLPDYDRSMLAASAEEAADRAKRGDWDEEQVTEEQPNG